MSSKISMTQPGKIHSVKTRLVKTKVLLTRPAGDNRSLANCLAANDFAVRELPLFAIQALPETPEQRTVLMNIDLYQGVISTSKHASQILVDRLDEFWPQLPVGIQWYAMGTASAQALQDAGLAVKLPLAGNTSEDLLRREDLQQLENCRFLLAKGCGGRDLIADTLAARGATVQELELYQRFPLQHPDSLLRELLQIWQPDQIVVLSAEALHRFWSLAENIGYSLKSTCFIVPSERVANAAREYQLTVRIAPTLRDEDLLHTVQQQATS